MENRLKYINSYKFLRIFARFLNYSFLPAFIFDKTNSLTISILYLVGIGFFTVLFNFLLKKQITNHIEFVLILSAFTFTLLQSMLLFNNINITFYAIMMAVLTGFDNVLTQSSIDYLYNTCPESEKPKNVKNTFIVENVSNAFAAFVGGMIVDKFGLMPNVVLSIITCFFSIAFIVIYLEKLKRKNIIITKEIETEYSNNQKSENENINISLINNNLPKQQKPKTKDKHAKMILSFAIISAWIVGVASRMGMSWSVYAKVINLNYSVIGILSSIICLGQVLFNIMTYKAQLKNKDFALVTFASIVLGFCWILRSFFVDLTSIYIFTILIGLFTPFLFQPIKERYLFTVKKYENKNSILYLDGVIRQSGCMSISLIGLALSSLGALGMQIMFIVGAVAIISTPLFYYFTKDHKKNKKALPKNLL